MVETQDGSAIADEELEELHLGCHQNDGPPLMLSFRGVCHHGAILAGSGAGKSNLVGRIVEEILLKTDARVVVIDTNGDFRKAHVVAEDNGFQGAGEKAGMRPPVDSFHSRAEFEKHWRDLRKIHLTSVVNKEPAVGLECAIPFLSWSKLPMQWQMDILGLDLSHYPEEVAALYQVTQRLANEDALGNPISPQTIDDELEMLATTPSIMNPLSESKTATALQMRFRKTAQLQVWKRRVEDVDLSYWFANPEDPLNHGIRPRLCTFDVPSISEPTNANILIAFLLKVLWEVAKSDWDNAVDSPGNKDKRPPIFLVVDEAHNFVPAEDPVDPHALRISQSIQRIAAEGRKYGLFLLLATQRPSKVRAGLLSECENVCLLRLRSPIERKLALKIWALQNDLSMLTKFGPGEGLLCGHWAGGLEIPFQGGLRRTKATGGDLPPDWIHTRARKS